MKYKPTTEITVIITTANIQPSVLISFCSFSWFCSDPKTQSSVLLMPQKSIPEAAKSVATFLRIGTGTGTNKPRTLLSLPLSPFGLAVP